MDIRSSWKMALQKWPTLLRYCLALLWVLWAIPIASMADYIKSEPYDLETEKRASQELVAFYSLVSKEALVKNTEYGPKDYFADLKRMDEAEYQIKKKYKTTRLIGMTFNPTSPVPQLQELMRANEIRGKFTNNDISLEAQNFSGWKKTGSSVGDEARETARKMTWPERFQLLLSWFIIFYPRSLFLMLILYLIRMKERRGLLQTILADKRQFMISIIAWPAYFWRYPFNIVREVVVAAEFRRMGDIFRRFTASEKEDIQQIASREDYRLVMAAFRRRYRFSFARSLWIAFLPALMLYLFVPVADASTEKVRKARGDTEVISISIQDEDGDAGDNSETTASFGIEAETGCYSFFVCKGFSMVVHQSILFWKNLLPDKIDNVPNFGCEVGLKLKLTN